MAREGINSMSEIKIDKGVPVPPRFRETRSANQRLDQDLKKLVVGDSFLAVGYKHKNRILTRMKKNKLKFQTRCVDKPDINNHNGYVYRIWKL
jgi:hypothetical protein